MASPKSDDSSDFEIDANLFAEPEGYYPPPPEHTFSTHTLVDKHSQLKIRLVGKNPLWGHLLWNAGWEMANYIESRAKELVEGKTVLELGAGGALPGLICGQAGAEMVLITDYPDPDLMANIRFNIKNAYLPENAPKPIHSTRIESEGYIWGREVEPLLAHLPSQANGFDLLILSDLIFNHNQHEALLSTLMKTLSPIGTALVFFTPHRTWLYEADLNFFKLCEDTGKLTATKVWEKKCEKPMFEVDKGDLELRKTVFGYEVKWKNNTDNSHRVMRE